MLDSGFGPARGSTDRVSSRSGLKLPSHASPSLRALATRTCAQHFLVFSREGFPIARGAARSRGVAAGSRSQRYPPYKWNICRKAAGISETNLPRYANNTGRANLIGGRTLITQ